MIPELFSIFVKIPLGKEVFSPPHSHAIHVLMNFPVCEAYFPLWFPESIQLVSITESIAPSPGHTLLGQELVDASFTQPLLEIQLHPIRVLLTILKSTVLSCFPCDGTGIDDCIGGVLVSGEKFDNALPPLLLLLINLCKGSQSVMDCVREVLMPVTM